MIFSIIHELVINAPAAAILNSAREPELLEKWWLKALEASGDQLTLLLSDNKSRLKLRLLSQNESAVEWLCLSHEIAPEWAGTKITFRTTPQDNATLLRFTHSGWQNTEGVYGKTSFYWAALYLTRLREVAEKNN